MGFRTFILQAPSPSRSTLYIDHYREQIEKHAPGLVPMIKELIDISQRRFNVSYGITEDNHVILETSLIAPDKKLPSDPDHPMAIIIGPKEIFVTTLLSVEELAKATQDRADIKKAFSSLNFSEAHILNELRQYLANLCRIQGMISADEEKYIHATRLNQPLADFVATRNNLCPHLKTNIALTSGGGTRATWGAAAHLIPSLKLG